MPELGSKSTLQCGKRSFGAIALGLPFGQAFAVFVQHVGRGFGREVRVVQLCSAFVISASLFSSSFAQASLLGFHINMPSSGRKRSPKPE